MCTCGVKLRFPYKVNAPPKRACCWGRVSYRRGRGDWSPPPPHQKYLKLSMVIIVLSLVLNNNLVPDFVRSNLRGSKFNIFLEGGACPQTPLVGTHAYAFARYYHPATILFFTPQLKILYETLWGQPPFIIPTHQYPG